MSTCDILTTQAIQKATQWFCSHTKPLLRMEPKMRIELTTYALRVLSLCSQVETSGLWRTGIAVDTRITRNWWKLVDRGGLTTELTTCGDIQPICIVPALITPSCCKSLKNISVIYISLAPCISGTFANSSATVSAKSGTIFVGQTWTNTLASLFGSPLQSSARWTCWRESVTEHAVRLYVKQLSSISQSKSDLLNHKTHHEVVEYLQSEFAMPC